MSDTNRSSTANSQSAVHIQSSASQPHSNSHSSYFVRRLIIALVLLFVLASVISSIAWLIVHPLPPVFTVNSFTVSNFTLLNSRVKGDYELVVSIKNPNKKASLSIDRSDDVCLMYDKSAAVIATAWMGPLCLEKMGQQRQSPRFRSDFCGPLHAGEFNEMSNDYGSKRMVSFNVIMRIRVRFGYRILPTKQSLMKVSCTNLVAEFSAAKEIHGKLKDTGGKNNCSVHHD
ncbi:Hydroxyproline-rich glycoprotein family protein [Citrus sinensis]|uniref:uncharacterized protein LOC107177499 n=1 Tax=Citrus sinensis TaxID=2711 RepID=UPI0007638435|nr:uncharacterized protein LOC107177499 [Citrus sinensis]KAH9659591.1 Hydroxyproline-rich glycoprotein family protein [Citrus sinensis]